LLPIQFLTFKSFRLFIRKLLINMNKILLLVSLCAIVCFTACKAKKEEKSEFSKIQVTNPIVLDTTFTKDYIAGIQSIQNIELRAQEKGYLKNIYVNEGQYVKAGQVLFTIMPKMYEAEVLKSKAGIAKANAGIAKAKAEIKIAETELKNTISLASKQIISKSEQTMAESKLEGAKAEYSSSNSELAAAKAELALAEVHLSFTTIKAPFDGVIDRIPHKLGSLIEEGELLTTLSDNKNIYTYFNFTELEYLAYKERNKSNTNEKVNLILANNEPYDRDGIIETIEGEFDSNTGTIAVKAKFPNPTLLLKHGETGKVRLTIPLHGAIIIPQKATFELLDRIYVFVVDSKNVVKAVNISVKQKLENLFVIDEGLSVNDKILLEGLQTVKEGDKIESEFIAPRDVMEKLQLIKN
jgi:membrane fusion protein, multidrug efflux system